MNLLKLISIIGLVLFTSCGLDSSNRNRIYQCRYMYQLEHCVTRDIDSVSFIHNCSCELFIDTEREAVPVIVAYSDNSERYHNIPENRLYYNYCNYWFISKDTL